jgi:hypothetical protein
LNTLLPRNIEEKSLTKETFQSPIG